MLVVVGYMTAIAAAKRGHNPAPFGDAISFLAVPLGDLVVFVGLIVPALLWRKHKETHKRLMLLATINLLGAAFTRFPILSGPFGLIPYAAMTLVLPVFDYLTLHRIPRAALWGSLWVVLTVPARPLVGQSDVWRQFAGWLVS